MLLKELFMRSFKTLVKQHWWFYRGKKVKLHRQNIEMSWHGSKLPWSAPKITLYMCRQISGSRCVTSMLKRQTSQYTQTVRYISCWKKETIVAVKEWTLSLWNVAIAILLFMLADMSPVESLWLRLKWRTTCSWTVCSMYCSLKAAIAKYCRQM